jgi:hypothetical protein
MLPWSFVALLAPTLTPWVSMFKAALQALTRHCSRERAEHGRACMRYVQLNVLKLVVGRSWACCVPTNAASCLHPQAM